MAVDYKTFDLEKLEFFDDSNWIIRLPHSLLAAIASLFNVNPGVLPVTFKGREKWIRGPSLDILGKAIGFDNSATADCLRFHQRRRTLWIVLAVSINLILVLFVSPLLLEGWDYLASLIYLLNLSALLKMVLVVVLFATIIPWFTLVAFGVAFRLTSAITNRGFAETLCVSTVVYVVIQLSRDDTLTRSDRRKALLARINDLARNTLLLSSRYSGGDDANQDWIKNHFKEMELYIRERERWVIAPTDITLDSLRRDFYRLASIYVTANYGSFIWPDKSDEPETEKPTWSQLLLASLPRLVGIFLPLALLGFFLWQPARLEALGIEPNVVALIFVAWLLLAIDANLKLGIVDRVAGLAKEMKELK